LRCLCVFASSRFTHRRGPVITLVPCVSVSLCLFDGEISGSRGRLTRADSDGADDTVASNIEADTTPRKKPPLQHGYIVIDEQRCKGCDLCIPACPVDIIVKAGPQRINLSGRIPVDVADMTKCIACNLCATVCPDQAIDVFRFARPIRHGDDS
jgi:2-oxoglutarate ferredoxin oxidoreductase subunit delta